MWVTLFICYTQSSPHTLQYDGYSNQASTDEQQNPYPKPHTQLLRLLLNMQKPESRTAVWVSYQLRLHCKPIIISFPSSLTVGWYPKACVAGDDRPLQFSSPFDQTVLRARPGVALCARDSDTYWRMFRQACWPHHCTSQGQPYPYHSNWDRFLWGTIWWGFCNWSRMSWSRYRHTQYPVWLCAWYTSPDGQHHIQSSHWCIPYRW